MKNGEYIRSMTDSELARYLCDNVYVLVDDCNNCPVKVDCSVGHIGFEAWLKKEASDEVHN